MGFYLCFFVSSSLLFSALTDWKWLSSLWGFFSPFCLLPLQCCFLLGGCCLLFFLLMFFPYSCVNNVKSHVLACSSWLLPICFSCSIFLAAVLSVFLSLVLWYLMSVDAKLSISSRLRERIPERKQVQQREQKLSSQCMYYYFFCRYSIFSCYLFTLPTLCCCYSGFTPPLFFFFLISFISASC